MEQSNHSVCSDLKEFWTALRLRDGGFLVDTYTGLKHGPVPLGRVNDPDLCIYAYNFTLFQDKCSSVYPCGLCLVPHQTMFILKGLCKTATAPRTGRFDVVYHHRGFRNGRPLFRWV